ncbi:MAG: hypothetical protein A2020_02360 [Lentisphaerae bacterium GWF2_45_14]|nr:MAG: hypothetical protein A2020_02360 [Lentisphaerae bacterium GWF2_45_14]
MRISAGKARGIILTVPPGLSVRPTAVRSRQALFDSLGDLSGLTILDLCAGSGGLGLEAASKNAACVTFVENSAKSARIIRKNIEKVRKAGVESELKVIESDALKISSFIPSIPLPDIIFCDPPYEVSAEYFSKLTADRDLASWALDSILIWELPQSGQKSIDFAKPELWKISKMRAFGGIEFLFLKPSLS